MVVVDEASMIDLAMMSKLVDALAPGARLILLGDRDQLASVESGAVLADCSRALPDNTVELQRTFRFDTGIKTLAGLVNGQRTAEAWSLIESGRFANVRLVRGAPLQRAVDHYLAYMQTVAGDGDESHYRQVFALFNRFRVLCAVRQGARGVVAVNQAIERGLRASGCRITPEETWYPGRPVLITGQRLQPRSLQRRYRHLPARSRRGGQDQGLVRTGRRPPPQLPALPAAAMRDGLCHDHP